MAAVLVVAGCSSSTIQGKAVKASGAHTAVVALMDTGAYATTPGHPFGVVGDDRDSQHLIEAHRMAELHPGAVGGGRWPGTLPGALDSGLTAPISSVKDMGSNGMMLAPWPDVAQAHGFISGFTSTRISPPQDGQSRGLQNVVLRFPDAAAAAAAAAEMAAKAPPLRDIAPSPPAPVANTPESLAVTYALPDGITRVDSFTPHGSFVLYQ